MEMGHGDTTNADPDSSDLYSRVKLRALNKKACHVENDPFAAGDGKSPNARSKKYSSRINQCFLSENVAANMETSSKENAFAVEDSWLRTLTEVTLKETNAFYTWRSGKKKVNDQINDVQDFDKSDLLLDEGTAVEMLDALRKERPKSSSNSNLDIGDLVWGRVKSYPWWPGQIFDEALASPSVQSEKREGGILVAFYGDYTYAWLAPQEIIPFDINYAENLKQTKVEMFLAAVEEAITEIKRRVSLGLFCHCQNHLNLQPVMMETNSVKQIQKARENFHPEEIIYFLKQLALCPSKNVEQNPSWIKNVANYFAYRKAVVKEIDEIHAQDFEALYKCLECPSGIMKDNQKASRDAEAPLKRTKGFKQLTEAYDLQKKDQLTVSHGCPSRKHFEEHELLIKCEESEFFRQQEPYDFHIFSAKRIAVEAEIHSRGLVTTSEKAENMGDIPKYSSEHSSSVVSSSEVEMISHQVTSTHSRIFPVKTYPDDASRSLFCSSKPLQEPIRPNDLTNAGNKRSISGCLEDSPLERPVRLKKNKSLPRFSSECQGESQGIRSESLIQHQKNSQLKQKSIRRDVIERMLTVEFPAQSVLPSVSEVKAKFACFGPLDEYSTRFFWKSSAYQLVFLHKSDAEAAYHHAIQNTTLFSASGVRYYLQASVHDFNESTDSLGLPENHEIQPPTSLSSNEYVSEQMSASFQPSLPLPEKSQLKSSLTKLSPEGSDCPSIIRSQSPGSITDNLEISKDTVRSSQPSNFPLEFHHYMHNKRAIWNSSLC